PDVEGEEQARVADRAAVARTAARVGEHEERERERHDREPEQPVASLAAPDQVGADHEPDEEVQRAGPARPGEGVRACRLDAEESRLDEPADPDSPRREPTRTARVPGLADVRERGLAIGDQRRPEEELSQPAPPPARA